VRGYVTWPRRLNNTGDFNGGYGIDGSSSGIDGGGNKAKGNVSKRMCRNVVCA
jgi:hypothetical protein